MCRDCTKISSDNLSRWYVLFVGDMRDAAIQVELDEEMVVRNLDMASQGLPSSYEEVS